MGLASLSPTEVEPLRRLSGSVLASSIERFGVRLSNSGFANSTIHAMFEDCLPMLGYAATVRIRTAEPPMQGRGYYKHTEWWNHILSIPEPRIVVVQDLDDPPGLGAFIGEVHANILMALGCEGLVTNGTVRDPERVETTGFRIFAGGLSLSHAYAHVVDFGGPVTVAGLEIRPGNLLHGDCHGVQIIPLEIAREIPEVAEAVTKRRQRLIDLCRSPDFSLDKFRSAIQETEDSIK